MRRLILAVAAVAAVVIAGAAQGAGSTRFVSKMYGYSIVLPGDWTFSRPASIPWRTGPVYRDSPEVDYYPSTRARELTVSARRVPRSSTLRKWTSSFLATYGTSGGCTRPKPRAYRATTLGGAPALSFGGRCLNSAHDWLRLTAIRGGRVYTLALFWPSYAYPAASNRSVFEAARRSFRFVR